MLSSKAARQAQSPLAGQEAETTFCVGARVKAQFDGEWASGTITEIGARGVRVVKFDKDDWEERFRATELDKELKLLPKIKATLDSK
jgi:hypothetical protein